jgi:hypothetical protein
MTTRCVPSGRDALLRVAGSEDARALFVEYDRRVGQVMFRDRRRVSGCRSADEAGRSADAAITWRAMRRGSCVVLLITEPPSGL